MNLELLPPEDNVESEDQEDSKSSTSAASAPAVFVSRLSSLDHSVIENLCYHESVLAYRSKAVMRIAR
jgi:hypothetical protein